MAECHLAKAFHNVVGRAEMDVPERYLSDKRLLGITTDV